MFGLIISLFMLEIDNMDMLTAEYIKAILVEYRSLRHHVRRLHANFRSPVSELAQPRVKYVKFC